MQSVLYRNYIASIQSDLKRDPRGFWRFVNLKRKSSTYPSTMRWDNSTASKTIDICNLFADYFRTVYDDGLDPSSTDHLDGQGFRDSNVNLGSIQLFAYDVHRALTSMDANKGPGPGVSPFVMKHCADSLYQPLCLTNHCPRACFSAVGKFHI